MPFRHRTGACPVPAHEPSFPPHVASLKSQALLLPEVILILAPLGHSPRVLCLSDQTCMHTIAKSGHEGGDRGGPRSGIHFSSLGSNAFSRFEHCIRSSRNWSPLQELASYILHPCPPFPPPKKSLRTRQAGPQAVLHVVENSPQILLLIYRRKPRPLVFSSPPCCRLPETLLFPLEFPRCPRLMHMRV